MPRHHPHLPELVGWSLLGLTLGAICGVVLAEWLAPRRRRPAGEGRPSARRRDKRLSSGATASRVRRAILDDPRLADVAISVLGIAPGVVEIAGWVEDRATRTHLARLARSVSGVETLVNSILVRGEDDPPPSPSLQLSGRTA